MCKLCEAIVSFLIIFYNQTWQFYIFWCAFFSCGVNRL
jgi:hypothetical protein